MTNSLLGFSKLKFVIIFALVVGLGAASFVFYHFYSKTSAVIESPVSPTEQEPAIDSPEHEGILPDGEGIIEDKTSEKNALKVEKEARDPADTSSEFNILILGIDRRYGEQKGWRTDVIQLLTLSKDRKKAVVTHIPRDVWADGYKINAVYNLEGPDAIKNQIQKITGQRPDRIIRVDFDAFVWAVDGLGGVNVNVPTAFVDSGYPNDRNGSDEAITVEFQAGPQVMDGETALIYTRSRKGTNGEGSDYARGARQQIIMQAAVQDFFKSGNIFNPKTAKTLYDIATQKVYTDINLADTGTLFEVMKNYSNISVKRISLDTSNFLEVPIDKASYGGAWTLVAKNNDYSSVHNAIRDAIK